MKTSEFSLWTKMKLRRKFTVVASMFTLVLAGLIAFNVMAVQSQRDATTITDLAGRQRSLTQKYAKEILLAGMGQGQQADHEATLRLLREGFIALADGGSVSVNLDSGARITLPPAPTAEIRARLAEQSAMVRQLEAEATRYLQLAPNDARRAEKLREILTLQTQLSAASDQVVKLFNSAADDRMGMVIAFQIVFGAVSAVFGMGISWMISRQIADPLAACANAANEIAKGNLRLEPQKVTSADELGVLQEAFNEMQISLRDIALQSRGVCENLTLAASQILASTQQQAAGTKQQAAAVQEITTTVEQISLSGKQVAERARQVAGTAEAVATSGSQGLQAVRDASVGMEAIREQAETVAENIITLSERTQAVGEIIATVNDIAEQSNLVALNAAIEAADAREQGRRFSVVANEIKNLADQAKEATSQVRGILEQTQKGINTSVMLTEEALKRVETGRERTSVSEQVIRQMAGNIQESVHAFQQIVGATNQQQIGLEQVTQALHEIRQASQQTANTTAQLERASLDLTGLGQQLAKTLEKYRL